MTSDPDNEPGRKHFHATTPADRKYIDGLKPKAIIPKKTLVCHTAEYVGLDMNKSNNAPNVPQMRDIDSFWTNCRRQYSNGEKKLKTFCGFRKFGPRSRRTLQ